MKILVACGNGMGSSVLLKMNIESILREYNVDANVDAISVGEALSVVNNYDYFIYPSSFEDRVSGVTVKKAGITNMVSPVDIKKAFVELGIIE